MRGWSRWVADHDGTPRGRRRSAWSGVAWTLAPLVPMVVLWVATASSASLPSATFGDQAVEELNTNSALHLHRLLGPYSRFGWHHPGPATFYGFAPFYAFAGHQAGGLALGAASINLVCVALIAAVVWKSIGRAGAIAGLAALTFGVWAIGPAAFRDPWNPLVVIAPVALVGVAGAAVLAGRRWLLPIVAAAATFAVQTHIGTAGAVIAMAATTVAVAAWRDREHLREWLAPGAVTVGVLAVGWALPLYQQFTNHPGNLEQLNTFFQAHHQPPDLWTVQRMAVVGFTLSASHLGAHMSFSAAPFPTLNPFRLALFAALVALLVVGLLRRRDEPRTFTRALCGVAIAGLVGTSFASTQVVPPVLGYLFTPAAGVGLVAWIAAAVTAGGIAEDLVADRTRVRRCSVAFAAGALVIAGAGLARRANNLLAYSAVQTSPGVNHLTKAIQAQLPAGTRSIELDIGRRYSWPDAMGAAAQLERQGVAVHVTAAWEYLAGTDHRLTGHERVRLLLATADDPRVPRHARAVFALPSTMDPRMAIGLFRLPDR